MDYRKDKRIKEFITEIKDGTRNTSELKTFVGLCTNRELPELFDCFIDELRDYLLLNPLGEALLLVFERMKGHPLPKELDNDKARYYLSRAIQAGWMTDDYKWNLNNLSLACFAVSMNEVLWGVQKRRNFKPFTKLFGLQTGDLSRRFGDVQKAGYCAEYERRRGEVFPKDERPLTK